MRALAKYCWSGKVKDCNIQTCIRKVQARGHKVCAYIAMMRCTLGIQAQLKVDTTSKMILCVKFVDTLKKNLPNLGLQLLGKRLQKSYWTVMRYYCNEPKNQPMSCNVTILSQNHNMNCPVYKQYEMLTHNILTIYNLQLIITQLSEMPCPDLQLQLLLNSNNHVNTVPPNFKWQDLLRLT